ncbi:hypothetical protein SAMN05216404_106204 [Nitrosospira multiformis]|uniref:Uncharacterized protein n=1 Tax=Nitrosospira multiformis TaxID=1231 RepID=A0A1H8IVY0_9PROT|nr:hypothetical protein [Nitrosospira multiformis]SEN72734.1 hypothetical protein SAMN05216404_106204 [Nitrosospira multiformis]
MNIPDGWKLVPEEPTPHMLVQGVMSDEGVSYPGGVYRAMLAAAPTPAQEDEPVAYVPIHPEIGPLFGATQQHRSALHETARSLPVMPLYTHPANDKLRKAAEETIAFLLQNAYPEDLTVIKNLRAALEGK